MTEASRQDFGELGVPEERIATITNGVDAGWFRRDRPVPEIRSDLGWPNDRPVILTTGRNHHKKGFHLIPAIADKLRADGHRFAWYVVGLGTDRLDPEIRSRDLQEYVTTHPQVGVGQQTDAEWRFPDHQLVRMYQAADVYAFPTLIENFPMVQLEAMAAGAAYVSTDAPGCRELVRHDETGTAGSDRRCERLRVSVRSRARRLGPTREACQQRLRLCRRLHLESRRGALRCSLQAGHRCPLARHDTSGGRCLKSTRPKRRA